MKKNKPILVVLFAGVMSFMACTPKVAEDAKKQEKPKTTVTTQPATNAQALSSCPKFSDAPNPQKATETHVLYRDFIKQKNYDEAFKLWQEVFAVAPAADGLRNTQYVDGIKIYEHFISKETDEAKKKAYENKIFELYDGLEKCYPKDASYVAGKKAFDLYYKYPNRVPDTEKYKLFKKALDTGGKDVPDYLINPFTDLLVKQQESGQVSNDEAKKYAIMIQDAIANGLKTCQGTACDRWKVINEYAPVRMEAFEAVKGFYDCEYYTKRYYAEFEANKGDCDIVDATLGRLMWGGCGSSNPKIAELNSIRNTKCYPQQTVVSSGGGGGETRPSTPTGPAAEAYAAMSSGDYNTAISKYKEAIEQASSNESKGQYAYRIANIYYRNLKRYSEARKFARDAANYKSGWGAPYVLIGYMYAGSGPLCGSGTGFESQTVAWAAVDKWQYAKSIDPSVADQVNPLIGKYASYFPSKEDGFMRGVTQGQKFTVGCWIGETTTARFK